MASTLNVTTWSAKVLTLGQNISTWPASGARGCPSCVAKRIETNYSLERHVHGGHTEENHEEKCHDRLVFLFLLFFLFLFDGEDEEEDREVDR